MADRPVCLLALDGGGIRGLSELIILEEIMSRIKYNLNMDEDPIPADFFDMIGGTSTGGLIALLLGRLRLSAREARSEYVRISGKVFSMRLFSSTSKFDCKIMEREVKELLKRRLGPGHAEDKMQDLVKPQCSVFVCAVQQHHVHAPTGPTLFRTYRVRRNAAFDCKIWEACRATSAAPPYFDPISIGDPGLEEFFIDGGIGYNNPTEQLLDEARRQFPQRKVACIVSIGTGMARIIQFPDSPKTGSVKLVEALKNMATEADVTAERVQVRFQDTHNTYFRFNVDRGLENIGLDEQEKLGNVRGYTTAYLKQTVVSSKVDDAVEALIASKLVTVADGSTATVSIPGHASKTTDSHKQPQTIPWHITDTLPDFRHKIEDAARVIPSKSSVPSKTGVWSVPLHRNDYFTGRESILDQLNKILFKESDTTNIVAISGLGGIGKTQIALELAYQVRTRFKDCSIFWMSATIKESIENAFIGAARALRIPGFENNKANAKELVRDFLSNETAGRWLLVFDNADEIDMWLDKPENPGLLRYLPDSPRGSILFTTRDHKVALRLASPNNIVQIFELDKAGSEILFRNYLFNKALLDNRTDTAALLEKLAYLPLAMSQAAAFINENQTTLKDYLAILNSQEEDVIKLLNEGFHDTAHRQNMTNASSSNKSTGESSTDSRTSVKKNDPVAITWLISFNKIRERDHLAAEYLSFMACIDAKDIPRSLLPSAPSHVDRDMALGTLKSYSLITQPSPDYSINIHRLVHLATRNWLRKEGRFQASRNEAISTLERCIGAARTKDRAVWRTYLPHASYLIESNTKGDGANLITRLMFNYGQRLVDEGRYKECDLHLMKAKTTSESLLGTHGFESILLVGLHASNLEHMGRYEEARKLYELAIERYNSAGYEKNFNVATAFMGSLAQLYVHLGHPDKAEKLGLHVFEFFKAKLGPENLDTASFMHTLSIIYHDLGRQEEAFVHASRARYIFESQLGAEDPRTLVVLEQLVTIRLAQWRIEEAENLLLQVIKSRERFLGNEHPDTLNSWVRLSGIYHRQKRLDEAETLVRQTLETQERTLGAKHRDTLSTKVTVALVLRDRGCHPEALALMQDCAADLREVLGPEHPHTISAETTLEKMS